jgi:hypothetical protein
LKFPKKPKNPKPEELKRARFRIKIKGEFKALSLTGIAASLSTTTTPPGPKPPQYLDARPGALRLSGQFDIEIPVDRTRMTLIERIGVAHAQQVITTDLTMPVA